MSQVRNIRLLIEYKGTSFAGWQFQPNQCTVQGEIEHAIFRVTGQKTTLIGAGRTDSGVHALGQVANFQTEHPLESIRFRDALNFHLSDDIRIRRSEEVAPTFHARFDATWRRYRYILASERSAIYRDLRWENESAVRRELLDQAAQMILGEHDFSSFCVTASLKESNLCTISHSRWQQIGPVLVYEIRGNRFLHGMVRSLVGGMVNLAAEQQDSNVLNLTLDDFQNTLQGNRPDRVVFTAPAHGLYLVAVGYPKEK